MERPFGLGAVSRPADRRDYRIGLSQAPAQIPPAYMPDISCAPVKMQGQYGTCGGHAGAMMESVEEQQDLSPKFLWKNIKQLDGIPLDGGTDMRSIFKAIQQSGVCHEALCPDVLDASLEQYSDPATLTDPMKNDAYPYGTSNYAFTDNPAWNDIKQAIYQNKAVIALVDCGDGWWTDKSGNSSWAEKDILPLRLGNFVDGHFITLYGYDQKYIYFRNSWSTAWGKNGDGYFDISYLPHIREIGVGIAAPSTKQQLVSLYQSLVTLLQKQVQLLRQSMNV